MESGKIPVLLDIVERGKHAPEGNMLSPQPASAGSEELLKSYADREHLVDQVMLELMPQLEALARDTIERILAESQPDDGS
ncbi:MAG TPA: hypothetical protein VIU36_00195 [Gammaproteobacteria bacterium]